MGMLAHIARTLSQCAASRAHQDAPLLVCWPTGCQSCRADVECAVHIRLSVVQEYCDAGNLGDYCIIHGDKQDGQLPTGHAMVSSSCLELRVRVLPVSCTHSCVMPAMAGSACDVVQQRACADQADQCAVNLSACLSALQLRLLFRLREVADGMHFLHETARVVHGDLKSNNILLSVAPTAPYGRTAKVADFGLARVYQAGETHKSTKTLGTVSSCQAEQAPWPSSSSGQVLHFCHWYL